MEKVTVSIHFSKTAQKAANYSDTAKVKFLEEAFELHPTNAHTLAQQMIVNDNTIILNLTYRQIGKYAALRSMYKVIKIWKAVSVLNVITEDSDTPIPIELRPGFRPELRLVL